jgi:hypothetical protein
MEVEFVDGFDDVVFGSGNDPTSIGVSGRVLREGRLWWWEQRGLYGRREFMTGRFIGGRGLG